MSTINVPDYYPQFRCAGSECPDTCCGGWAIGVDKDTFRTYQQSKHPALAPLFKLALSKNTSATADSKNNFGVLNMRADGRCHFLQEDQLCSIHGHMGARALSSRPYKIHSPASHHGRWREYPTEQVFCAEQRPSYPELIP